MRVLVTGGSGYIGAATAWELLKHGHEVWIHDRRPTGAEPVPPQQVCPDLDSLPPPDAVIHLAAATSVTESLRDPLTYYRANVQQTVELLDWMRAHEVQRIVFASSAAVYTLSNTHPASTILMPPPSPYGQSKLMCERILADCARAYRMSAVVLRYFNVAGAILEDDFEHGYRRDPPQRLIPLAISRCVAGKPLTVYGRPNTSQEPVRDFVHVADVAEANRRAVELEHNGVVTLNVGTGIGTRLSEALAEVEQASGLQILKEYAPPRPGDVQELVDRGRRETEWALGWLPSRSLKEIVRSDVDWFLSHSQGEEERNGEVAGRVGAAQGA